MVTGTGGDGRDAAVILELKQWDRCGDAGADNLVTTRLGGAERDVLHPAAQVGQAAGGGRSQTSARLPIVPRHFALRETAA